MSVKDYDESIKPREKAINSGVGYLADNELLAILLRTGNKTESCLELAGRMIIESEGIAGLANLSIEQLMDFKGIGKAKATEIAAALELSKRISYERLKEAEIVSGPEFLIDWLQKRFGNEKRECLVVIFMNIKNKLLGYKTIYKGTANEISINVGEIYNEALIKKAAKIIVAHNHPSGNVHPSLADNETTLRLFEAGKILGIRLVDHIIVGSNSYYSYSEQQKI